MVINSITYTHSDDSSCTGSHMDYFDIMYDDVHTVCLSLDIWYHSAELIRKAFMEAMSALEFKMLDFSKYAVWFSNRQRHHNGPKFENVEDAYKMYVDEIVKHKRCPETKEELFAVV